jgi:hypothetical protein
MSEATCEMCDEKPLLLVIGAENMMCPTCDTEYVRCAICRPTTNQAVDYVDNDKGMYCALCERHFCASCWQSGGKWMPGNNEWICSECRF